MRNSKAKDRCPRILGAMILVTLALILSTRCAGRFGADTNNTAEKGSEEICTTTMTSTTLITSTRSNTTTSTAVTSTKTTSTTTKTETVLPTEIIIETTQTEMQTEPVVTEPETEPEPQTEPQIQILPYNESDAVLLAQLINKESSVYWDGMVAVADCVVNRANYNGFTISEVIYAPGQFTTAYSLGYYNADNYNAAVQVLTYGSTDTRIYFFDGNHGGLNWFYDINRNYLYAA